MDSRYNRWIEGCVSINVSLDLAQLTINNGLVKSKILRFFIINMQMAHGPTSNTGPRSAVGNVSGYRCVSDCNSRGHEFDPGPVPYFRGDWSWNNFYGHSPPFGWFIQEGLFVSYKRKYVHKLLVNRLFKPAQEKVWLGELTVPQWP